jgi:hypothetical protein
LREVIALHRRYLEEDRDLRWLRRKLAPLRRGIQELLERGSRGHRARTARLCQGLLCEYDALWTFCDVKDAVIPITNNTAEVRHEVTRDKWIRGKEGRLMLAA